MSNTKKFLDYEGVKHLWSKINMNDYPNNQTLMNVIEAIDETKADKTDLNNLICHMQVDLQEYNDDGDLIFTGNIPNYVPQKYGFLLLRNGTSGCQFDKGYIKINDLEPLPIIPSSSSLDSVLGESSNIYTTPEMDRCLYFKNINHYIPLPTTNEIESLLRMFKYIYANYYNDFHGIPTFKEAVEILLASFKEEQLDPLYQNLNDASTQFIQILDKLIDLNTIESLEDIPSLKEISPFDNKEQYRVLTINLEEIEEYIVFNQDDTYTYAIAKIDEYQDIKSILYWKAEENREEYSGSPNVEYISDNELGNGWICRLSSNGTGIPLCVGIKESPLYSPGIYITVIFQDNIVVWYPEIIGLIQQKMKIINPEYLPIGSVGYETTNSDIKIGPKQVKDYDFYTLMEEDKAIVYAKKILNNPIDINLDRIQVFADSLLYQYSQLKLSNQNCEIFLIRNTSLESMFSNAIVYTTEEEYLNTPIGLAILYTPTDQFSAGIYSIGQYAGDGNIVMEAFISRIVGLEEDKIYKIDEKFLPEVAGTDKLNKIHPVYEGTLSNETASATGDYALALGYQTTASSNYSYAEGNNTIASSGCSHVQGKYNVEDNNTQYAHIVGNGSSGSRSNAHTLDWDGNAWFAGDVYIGSTSGTNKDEGSKKLATIDDIQAYIDSAILGGAW